MRNGHRLGELGEDLARTFLQTQGLTPVEARFRVPGGEIDLVMREGALVVFVEVKTRSGHRPARPEEFFTGRQLARLRRAASVWLTRHEAWGNPCRFDLVAVELQESGQGASIRHYRQVG